MSFYKHKASFSLHIQAFKYSHKEHLENNNCAVSGANTHTDLQHQILFDEQQFYLRVNYDRQTLKKIFGLPAGFQLCTFNLGDNLLNYIVVQGLNRCPETLQLLQRDNDLKVSISHLLKIKKLMSD